MKKSMRKLIISILLVLLIVVFFNRVALAGDYSAQMGQLITDSDNAFGATEGEAEQTVRSVVVTIIGVAKIVGVCIAVGMLLAIAMKYMSAAPGEKAEIKKSAVVYVVGAIVLFAVTGLLTIIEKFATVITV